jgi:hypothetical protein
LHKSGLSIGQQPLAGFPAKRQGFELAQQVAPSTKAQRERKQVLKAEATLQTTLFVSFFI